MAFKMKGFSYASSPLQQKDMEASYKKELKKLEFDFRTGKIGGNEFREKKKTLLKKYKKI